ncbi:MAG: peptidyl-prolyl cis-trans isomerase [Alphaproteobacteria bacterium]|nr:MAG: peptidyl-prolyl cis-trans isomerase [Alphaproteobacteria bacterium]
MRPFVIRFLKDPLFQFLFIGALLFAVVSAVRGLGPTEEAPHRITVSEDDILTFLQFKLGAFEPDKAKARLQAMTPEERRTLINDFVRNEVLVREAKGIGLSENDAVIRQRLIQRMEFALESVVAPTVEPDDEILQAHLAAHPELFRVAASVTFTHVYYRDGQVPEEDLRAFWSNTLDTKAALERGDVFPYFDNYSERTPAFISSHFGEDFTANVFAEQAPVGKWIGPLSSPHGTHWVLITKRVAPHLASLESVKEMVREDYLRTYRDRAVLEAVDALVSGYDIEIAPELETP